MKKLVFLEDKRKGFFHLKKLVFLGQVQEIFFIWKNFFIRNFKAIFALSKPVHYSLLCFWKRLLFRPQNWGIFPVKTKETSSVNSFKKEIRMWYHKIAFVALQRKYKWVAFLSWCVYVLFVLKMFLFIYFISSFKHFFYISIVYCWPRLAYYLRFM